MAPLVLKLPLYCNSQCTANDVITTIEKSQTNLAGVIINTGNGIPSMYASNHWRTGNFVSLFRLGDYFRSEVADYKMNKNEFFI